MNTIARTLSTLTAAAALVLSAAPSLAADSPTIRLVERADGTLAVQKGGLYNGKAGSRVLAETQEEIPTYTTPIKEVDTIIETDCAAIVSSALSNDPDRMSQWGLSKLEIESAWSHSKGEGVKVAVIDTGIDKNHPDFEGRVIRGYTAPGQREGDYNGHGTHVAGIIGAGDNNQIAGSGVAPDVTIFEAKVTQDSGVGNSSWMAEGIVAAINANVDIINISMTANSPMPLVEAAINQAVARNITVFAAAGNDGLKGSPTRWPAAYANTVAVASITRDDKLSPFSNTNDYVDLTAPGSSIKSTVPNGAVGFMSGTSQATPHAAGAAALLKSYNHNMTNHEVRETLISTTTGKLRTLNIMNAIATQGFKKEPVQSIEQPVNTVNPLHQSAPKPINPVRHFSRPER
ncbi:S8 family peptidase [Stomatohabitans albus]|uniref:S8 family peptidase n=1 Tax=Stomatohabitans albus TaxID=3110766 RepID=UPI00300CA0E3